MTEFERLAQAIAKAVHDGPRDEIKKYVGVESVIGEWNGTTIQLIRSHDIMLDEWQYRCHIVPNPLQTPGAE